MEVALMSAIATLAGVVAVLWRNERADAKAWKEAHAAVDAKAAECERDRLELWRTISMLSRQACGDLSCPSRKSETEHCEAIANRRVHALELKLKGHED